MATNTQVERLAEKLFGLRTDGGHMVMESVPWPNDKVMVTCRIIAQYLIDNGAWEVPKMTPIPRFQEGRERYCCQPDDYDKMVAKRREMLG